MRLFILVWCACALGFMSLAVSMHRHQEQVFGKCLDRVRSRIAAAAGWLFLFLGLALCVRAGAPSNMISYWAGVLTLAALVVGLCLAYRARQLPALAAIAAIVAIAAASVS
jgi:Protein of unknown function (DUF3325).